MANLNLKGLWIPIEILTDTNLSDKETHIYSIIMFLSKENNYCYCTNSNISELLNISITQVSKLVNSLKKKGYIDIEIKYKDNSKEIESRKLIPKMASDFTKGKLENATKVELEFDEVADKKDKYDRYLAWIWVDDELLQNLLVQNGLAETYMLQNNYKYAGMLQESEELAKESKLGIWSENTNSTQDEKTRQYKAMIQK